MIGAHVVNVASVADVDHVVIIIGDIKGLMLLKLLML